MSYTDCFIPLTPFSFTIANLFRSRAHFLSFLSCLFINSSRKIFKISFEPFLYRWICPNLSVSLCLPWRSFENSTLSSRSSIASPFDRLLNYQYFKVSAQTYGCRMFIEDTSHKTGLLLKNNAELWQRHTVSLKQKDPIMSLRASTPNYAGSASIREFKRDKMWLNSKYLVIVENNNFTLEARVRIIIQRKVNPVSNSIIFSNSSSFYTNSHWHTNMLWIY